MSPQDLKQIENIFDLKFLEIKEGLFDLTMMNSKIEDRIFKMKMDLFDMDKKLLDIKVGILEIKQAINKG